MARVTRLARRGIRAAVRPTTNWTRIVSSVVTVVPVSSKVLLASLNLSNPGIGETIRRTIGRIMVLSDQASVHEEQLGAFGLVVVNDLALAAGAASIPGPVTEAGDDGWFVWEPLIAAGSQIANPSGGPIIGLPFQSRAMRRVEEGFSVAIMVENASALHVFEFAMGISLLTSRIG